MNLIGDITADIGIFEGFDTIETYSQILIGILFTVFAFISLPINTNTISLQGPIPIEFIGAVILIALLHPLSGIIRWIVRIFGIFGKYTEEKLEDRIQNR